MGHMDDAETLLAGLPVAELTWEERIAAAHVHALLALVEAVAGDTNTATGAGSGVG